MPPLAGEPAITVCITTHNRPDLACRAVASALDQEGPSLLAVVVNNGQDEHTRELAKRLRSPRVSVVSIPDRGLCASRNEALTLVRTPWVAFLDDDDHLLPGWSEVMVDHMTSTVGIISCSLDMVTEDGDLVRSRSAERAVDQLDGVHGLHLPGCFSVRTDLIRAVGGYLPGLPCSHQTELWIRLVDEARRRNLAVATDPRVGTVMTSRPSRDRPLMDPRMMLDGSRWMAVRHPEHFARLPDARADLYGIAGVNAARLGDLPLARRLSARALKAQRRSPVRWARLATTLIPPAAHRAWVPYEPSEPAVNEANSLRILPRLAREHPRRLDDLLFLPDRYQTNPSRSSDRDGDGYWSAGIESSDVRYQEPVYRWAARILARGMAAPPVVDIGCGWGEKLVRCVGRVTTDHIGLDQRSGIDIARREFPGSIWLEGDLGSRATWGDLRSLEPRLVICADVIEHVEDPYGLLESICALIAAGGGHAIISTPDRSRLDEPRPHGPPYNPRHIREWTRDELALVFEAAGLRVLRSRRFLPRSYDLTSREVKRLGYRILRRRAIPDRRSNLAFLVEAQRRPS